MHIRHLVTVGATALVPFSLALTPAAADEPSQCAVTDVASIDELGRPTDDAGEVAAVVASLTGDLPIDARSTISEVVRSATDATEPVWTTLRSTFEGAEATASPVTGAIPADLDQLLEDALGCVDAATATADTPNPVRRSGNTDSGEPQEGPSGGDPVPTSALPAASAATTECQVTSVLPVDATGTVITNVAAAEGAVVAVTGPLPVGAADTIAGAVQTATGTAEPLAVTVIETVDTIEVTVTGVTGPLPADLSTTLADALGCEDTTTADPTDPSDPADPGEPAGSQPSDRGDESTSGGTSVAGEQIQGSGGFLPRTGAPISIVAGAGSALLGAGGLARVLRRLALSGQDPRSGI